MSKKQINNKLRIKIDFDGFKLDVLSDNPNKTLAELNRLIISKRELFDAMGTTETLELFEPFDEEDFSFEFKTRMFTKELKRNSESVETMKTLFLKYKNFLYRKERLETKQEIDLNNKKFTMIIEKKNINTLVKKLLFDINIKNVRHTFIHVIGDYFSKDHQSILLDEVKKKTGFADVTFLFTHKKFDSGLVAETLFFGDFPTIHEEG